MILLEAIAGVDVGSLAPIAFNRRPVHQLGHDGEHTVRHVRSRAHPMVQLEHVVCGQISDRDCAELGANVPVNGEPIQSKCRGLALGFDVILQNAIRHITERRRIARDVLQLERIAAGRNDADVSLRAPTRLIERQSADAADCLPPHAAGCEPVLSTNVRVPCGFTRTPKPGIAPSHATYCSPGLGASAVMRFSVNGCRAEVDEPGLLLMTSDDDLLMTFSNALAAPHSYHIATTLGADSCVAVR